MKTTIELDDDLYRRVKVKSAMEGRTVREVATSLFQQWADGAMPAGQDPQNSQGAGAAPDTDARRRRELWLADFHALGQELGPADAGDSVVEQLLDDRQSREP
ncbi:MAG TPA: hypothetical protein VE869_03315 [Gemmatimonas sp.]|nr:hypothetical protein [Gemmatimonas sp.]